MNNPNPTNNRITVDIGDGVQRELRFSYASQKRLEEKLGAKFATEAWKAAAEKHAQENGPFESVITMLEEMLRDRKGNLPEGVDRPYIEECVEFNRMVELQTELAEVMKQTHAPKNDATPAPVPTSAAGEMTITVNLESPTSGTTELIGLNSGAPDAETSGSPTTSSGG